MERKHLETLQAQAARIGLALTQTQIDAFAQFAQLLLAGRKRANITGILEPEDIVYKHYLDSLYGGKLIPPDRSVQVIDIGSGAGFPGVPLKIYRPQILLTLLESNTKKVAFLKEALVALQMTNVVVCNSRAEVSGHLETYRETFDYAVARAVSELRILMEYALPFLAVGGRLIAYKGPDIHQELEAAHHALRELGGVLEELQEFELGAGGPKRSLVIIRKECLTPKRYPRRAGIPAKRPL